MGIFKGFQGVSVIAKILFTLAVASVLIAILPISPFESLVDSISSTPYLGYLNWFFPIGRCLTALTAWCTAIVSFYAISWILRQLDIVGS